MNSWHFDSPHSRHFSAHQESLLPGCRRGLIAGPPLTNNTINAVFFWSVVSTHAHTFSDDSSELCPLKICRMKHSSKKRRLKFNNFTQTALLTIVYTHAAVIAHRQGLNWKQQVCNQFQPLLRFIFFYQSGSLIILKAL